jgi:cytochrome c peroxidase
VYKKYYILIIIVFCIFLFSCKEDSYKYIPKPFSAILPIYIDTAKSIGPLTSPFGNPITYEGIELGRKLFYDTRLSGNNSISCANCHQQQFAFGDNKQFSTGFNTTLTSRNSPQVFNAAWDKDFFWDGRRKSLESQAHDPITSPGEMNGNWNSIIEQLQNDNRYPYMFYQAFGSGIIDSNMILKAIAQFERSMVSFNSKFDKYNLNKDSSVLTISELRGLEIYLRKGTCNSCHTLPLGRINHFANIGLEKGISDSGLYNITHLNEDIGKFKTPSIRNSSFTPPYMHNGKFKTMREVINFYNNDINNNHSNIDPHLRPLFSNKGSLSNQDIEDLLAFIKTLDDYSFITNPAYSNPR